MVCDDASKLQPQIVSVIACGTLHRTNTLNASYICYIFLQINLEQIFVHNKLLSQYVLCICYYVLRGISFLFTD